MDSIKTADVIDNSSFILTKMSTCSRLKEKDYNK